MNLFIKQFIIVILLITTFLAVYFGSIAPFVKAKSFISLLIGIQNVTTLEGLTSLFDKSVKFYSPVGDEETIKYLNDEVMKIISQEEKHEIVDRTIVNYVEPYWQQNNIRHVLAAAQMYAFLWEKYGDENAYLKAENYYRKSLTIGPRLPWILYNLFDLYQKKGYVEKTKEIGGLILQYWPEDEKTKEVINKYN